MLGEYLFSHHVFEALSLPWLCSKPVFRIIKQLRVAEKQANLSTPAHAFDGQLKMIV
jgi:hypothetical protein